MVGILDSFWDGLFSGAMLVSGRVLNKLVHLSCFNLNNLQVEEYRVHLRLERHWSWVFFGDVVMAKDLGKMPCSQKNL